LFSINTVSIKKSSTSAFLVHGRNKNIWNVFIEKEIPDIVLSLLLKIDPMDPKGPKGIPGDPKVTPWTPKVSPKDPPRDPK